MTKQEVIKIIRSQSEKQFPKTCPTCGRQYNSLKEYFQNTSRIGSPISYDALQNDWQPKNPLGTMSLANCGCGSTLSISSKGTKLLTLWRLMQWAKMEISNREISMEELLEELREIIIKQVIAGKDH